MSATLRTQPSASSTVAAFVPLALGPGTLLLGMGVAVLAALLAIHAFAQFGAAPAGELVVLGLGGFLAWSRTPAGRWLEHPGRRLLLLTFAAVGATSGGVGLLLAAGLPFVAGQQELIGAVLVVGAGAAAAGCLLALWLARLVPDAGRAGVPLPLAELGSTQPGWWRTLLALLGGLSLGLWGARGLVAALPTPSMAAFGLGLLGNPFGLALLAAGLVGRQYGPTVLGVDFDRSPVAPGLLLGAGLLALVQGLLPSPRPGVSRTVILDGRELRPRRWPRAALAVLLAFPLLGLVLAAATGASDARALGAGGLVGLLAASLTAGVLRVGAAPTATSAVGGVVAGLLLALWLGLEPTLAVVLAALCAPVGPVAAETAGMLSAARAARLMGLGGQVVLAAVLAVAAGTAVAAAAYPAYFGAGFVPPPDRAIGQALDYLRETAGHTQLAPWMLAGALVQLAGGRGRQAGLLLASGLAIHNPVGGWSLLAALVVRGALTAITSERLARPLALAGLACILGEILALALGLG